MRIVLLSGHQGAGKTTIAQAVKKKFIRYSLQAAAVYKFAEPLYSIHAEVQKIMEGYGFGWKGIDGKLLQVLGTEWGREKDPDLWCKIAASRFKNADFLPAVVLFDDCRFYNEFVAFDKQGYEQVLKVRLECPEAIRRIRAEKWRNDTQHQSETELDDEVFDLWIDTDETTIDQAAVLILHELGYKKP